MKYLLALLPVLVLPACGPTTIVMHNPTTGMTQHCTGDALRSFDPSAEAARCAADYERIGWRRVTR